MSRFDPRGRRNRALLVGVSEYDHTAPDPQGVSGQLPAVRHNRRTLEDALHRGGVFRPGEVRVLASPAPDDFTAELRRAVRETEGLLLLYFAGHAVVTDTSTHKLHLQMRTARIVAGEELPGAVSFAGVLGELCAPESRAEKVLVILDCCYAGNAAAIWHRFEAPQESKEKILLLMSVQPNRCILGGDADVATPFTREVAGVLDGGGEVWLSTLYPAVKQRMADGGYEAEDNDPQKPQALAPPWNPDADVLLAAGPVHHHLHLPHHLPYHLPPRPPRPPGPGPAPRPPRHRLRGRLRAAADRLGRTALSLLLALAATGAGGYGLYVLLGDSGPCAPSLELRVLTDPDLEPALRASADAYVASAANTTGEGCRRSGVTVYSAGAADVVTALGERTDAWQQPREDDNPQRDIGPQPDVWIPATRADVDRVNAAAAREDRVFARLEPAAGPLAYSPVVLAVPAGLGARLDVTGRLLSELVDALEQADPRAELHRPDPEFTDAALLATMGLQGARADARGAERRLARADLPDSSAVRLLCSLPEDDAVDDRSAALVPEFLLKSGIGCHPATRTQRVAAYPADVPGLEPAFVRVRWEDGDRDAAARDDAVDRFRAWLTGKDGLAVLGEHGFRSATGERRLLGPQPASAGFPASVGPAEPARPEDMERALDRYANAHGPGRVLYLLDSSGSMAGRWDGDSGGPGILKQTLPGLGGEDEYGVWAVHGVGGRTHTGLLDFGTHGRADAERALDAARWRDAEADPGAALLDALEFMEERGAGDERPQLIVYLTDGEDDGRLTGRALRKVLDRAGGAGVPVAMVSLASSGCDEGRPATRVAEAGRGRCLDAGDDLVPALHDEVARTGTGEER
ncbi:substrate-binding domain-containing protein [Streptomyces sp. NPDC057837]|uniref:substrate-binding domain-containing protein n=1 Tax=Streptomyces sp. NPDC057837 TaxID=3346260 RepID=UPI0036AD4649